MTKSKLTEKEQVEVLVQTLDATSIQLIEHIRSMMFTVSPLIGEQVKWNSVSFYYNGAMEAFDPKTYARDLMVCNFHRGKLLLVFPTGAKIKDDIKGKDYPDGRKIISIENLEDLLDKTDSIKKVVESWLAEV